MCRDAEHNHDPFDEYRVRFDRADDPEDMALAIKWPLRVGIGGPVGSGKTTLLESLVPRLIGAGHRPVVITNDLVTREDAEHVARTLAGVLDSQRVVGVQTGSCPHSAVREDPTMNLAALEELMNRFPEADIALIESGGDNLTLTFSPALVDYQMYVIDVAGGDKIPRKRGAGIVTSDLLVVNKIDLAPHVGASLDVMARDARIVRDGRPFVFTNCQTGIGVDEILTRILSLAEQRLHSNSQVLATASSTASFDPIT